VADSVPNYLYSWASVTIYIRKTDLEEKEILGYKDKTKENYAIKRLERDTFPFVSQVAVQQTVNVVDSITINLDMPFQEGKDLFDGFYGGILRGGNLVKVQFGDLSGLVSREYVGTLQEGGVGLSLSPEGLSGTLTAVGVMVQGTRAVSTEADDNEMRLQDRIKLASKRCGYKLEPRISETANNILERFNPPPGVEGAEGKFKTSGTISPLSLIQRICIFCGLVFRPMSAESDDGMYVSILAYEEMPLGRFTFVMRGTPWAPSEDDTPAPWPIISFSPTVPETVFYTGINPRNALRVHSDVSESGEPEVSASGEKEVPVPKTLPNAPTSDAGKEESAGPNDAPTKTVEEVPKPADISYGNAPAVGDIARLPRFAALYSSAVTKDLMKRHQMRFMSGMDATLTTTGCLGIQAGEIVQIANCGQFLDGGWKVMGFTHTWNEGQIETQMQLVSYTGLGASGVLDPLRTSGKGTNQQTNDPGVAEQ